MTRCWCALAALGTLAAAGCAPAYDGPVHTMQPAPFRAVLAERGEVGSAIEVPVAAPFSAKLNTLVPEGTVVRAGALLGTLGVDEKKDAWRKTKLRLEQVKLQLPLAEVKGAFDVAEEADDAANADLDLQIATLKLKLLVEGRAGTQIVEAAETVGTLEAERQIVAATLPEAEALRRKGYVSDEEVRQMRARLGQIDAERRAVRAKLQALEAGPRAEEIGLERLKVEQAASAREAARKRLAAKRVEAALEVDAARHDLERATERESYRAAQVRLGTLHAPRAGVVIYESIWTGGGVEKVKPGDAVEDGSAIVKIADPARQVVRAEIQEAAAGALTRGLPVRCMFDAYPGLVVLGAIQRVAPVAKAKLEGDLNRIQAIEAEVALARPDPRLKPGMSANIELVLAEQPGQLALPSEALRRDGAQAYVWRVEGGRIARRDVTLGAANATQTVVTAGLAAGDQVALRGPGGEP